MHIRTYVRMYESSMHICTYVRKYVLMYVCIIVCSMHICTYVRMYIVSLYVRVYLLLLLLFYCQRVPLQSNTTCFGFLILK